MKVAYLIYAGSWNLIVGHLSRAMTSTNQMIGQSIPLAMVRALVVESYFVTQLPNRRWPRPRETS